SQITKLSREMVNLNNLSFICRLPANSKDPYALMIVNIKQSKLQEIISDNLGENDITVIDEDGNLVYTTNDDVYHYYEENEDKFNSHDLQSIKLKDGKAYNIAIADSDELAWKYIVSYDVDKIRAAADKILSFSIVMFTIVIMGFVMSILATRKIYKPVSSLTDHIHELENEEKSKRRENEFEYIAKSIDNLVGKNTALEKLIESQQGQLTELFQLRLIKSEIKQDQLEYYLSRLKLSRQKYLSVISINIRSQDAFEEYDEARQDAVRIGVVEN
ncbi:hypothetical protein CG709_05155, partial [Lachnotalea glycerini]